MNVYKKNLLVLEEYHPEQYRLVSEYQGTPSKFEVLEAKNGEITIKFNFYQDNSEKGIYLHSKFNPTHEGQKFANECMKGQKEVNLLYGFGLGYHVQSICDLLSLNNKLVVFDTHLDVFIEAMKCRDLSSVFQHKNIRLFISDHQVGCIVDFAGFLNNKDNTNIIMHVPSVNTIRDSQEGFRYVLQELNLRKSINERYVDLMEENYRINKININRNVGRFFGVFSNIPIIIVCAGPSLDKNVHLLKGLDNRAIIICVGEALKSLINLGVKPHFIVTIDPDEITYKQIQGLENLSIPFILLATAASINGEKYLGPKFMACQNKAYISEGTEEFLIKTGGSVSTTTLDIAIRMGGNPIIFIGQDLAYSDNKHHCTGSSHEDVEIKYLKNMRTIKSWDGKQIPTTLGMISFNRWIQNRVIREDNRVFINATEGGAYIEGLIHMSFKQAISKYLDKQYNFSKTINKIILSK